MLDAIDALKTIAPATLAFVTGIACTPVLTHYLFKFKAWKKKSVVVATDGGTATISQKLHNDEERKTPRMGGIVVWGSAVLATVIFWLLATLTDDPLFDKLNFVSRNQTWLPLFTLIMGALVGLLDDYLVIKDRYDQAAGGLSALKRLIFVLLVAIGGAWWFYSKLDMSSIIIPLWGALDIGFLFVPFFIIVVLGCYSSGVIDGLDGLSGGVFATIFTAYGVIAFSQNQLDLAALCFVIVGGLLAFLWFNIPPARFFMGETGTMGLTMTLAVIAFLTGQVLLLPVIAFLLVATALSSTLQLASKKLRGGKKLFLVAPMHHYFQAAKGWSAPKVVMRYWVFGVMCAFIGVIIALIG